MDDISMTIGVIAKKNKSMEYERVDSGILQFE